MKKRFIYGSTGSLYQPGPLPAPETSPTYPAARAPYYLGSKLLGELYVEHLRLTQGLDSVAFRIGAAYGASVTRSIVKRFVSDALAGQPLPVVHGGMVRSDFTYVEDLASLFLSAVRGKQSGVFNAGSGMATSILQIAEAVCEVFAEFKPVIHHVQDSSERPPDFAVLCMEKTNAAFAHAPVAFGAGLRRMKDELLARG
jgi:UDP-glucose 4-epimerase